MSTYIIVQWILDSRLFLMFFGSRWHFTFCFEDTIMNFVSGESISTAKNKNAEKLSPKSG